MSFNDYNSLEKIMESFYTNGKLEATGHAKGNSAGDDLSHQCFTHKMKDGGDALVYIKIDSSDDGISRLTIQTNDDPEEIFGFDSAQTDPYTSYENTNWEQFEPATRGFFGLYGYADATTKHMNGLGFIERDTACFDNFANKVGDDLSWISPIPGTEQVLAVLPEEFQTYLDEKLGDAGSILPTTTPSETTTAAAATDDHEGHDHEEEGAFIPTHEHDAETEGGLIAVCVIIWVAVLILIIVFFYQYRKEKQGNNTVAYSVQ